MIQPSVPTLGMPSKFEVINHLAALKAQQVFWTKILRAQEALEDQDSDNTTLTAKVKAEPVYP